MCTSSEPLPNADDAIPEIPIDEFTASALGLVEAVKQHIIEGISVNAQNIEGWSMLQYACFIGHTSLVGALVELGADANLGATPPLHLAARCGNEPILVLLLNQGASITQLDNSGLSALQHAVNSGQEGSVTVLMRHSKLVSPSDSNVLLHSAVNNGNRAVLKALLDSGLVPSSATRLSMIEIARSRGDSDLLQLVLSCGNFPSPQYNFNNRQSEDPFNRYLQRGPMEMQRLLQSATLQSRFPLAVPNTRRAPIPSSPGVMSPISPSLNPALFHPPTSSLPSFNTVGEVLQYLKLEKYSSYFEREDIDLNTFLTLTDNDMKAIGVDLLGPRKKILNHIKVVQSNSNHGNSSSDQVTELQMALLSEQQKNQNLAEKVKQDKENEGKNHQIIQSLFASYQSLRDNKDKIITTLTNASYIVQHIEEELLSCKEVHERLPKNSNNLNNSGSSSSFASSWPCIKQSKEEKNRDYQEEILGEHIALSSVNSVLDGDKDTKFYDKQWSWDDYTSGSSSSTLNASYSADKLKKHLNSAMIYLSSLYQHLTDAKLAANNIPVLNNNL